MKIKFIVVALLLGFIAQSPFAQTKSDLDKQYGVGRYYEVSSGVLMNARFDQSGQICEAYIQPLSVYDDRAYDDGSPTFHSEHFLLYPYSLKLILDEIAPAINRGKALSTSSTDRERNGKVRYRSFKYTNLSVLTGKNIFIENDYDDQIDMEKGYFGSAQFVRVSWLNRKCIVNY